MQRLLLFCAQLVAGAASRDDWNFLLTVPPVGQWSYDESMPTGRRQSPVNIITCATSQESKPIVLTSFSETPTSMTLKNIDNVAALKATWENYYPRVYGAGLPGNFQAVGVVFHWGRNDSVGSEHTINGLRYSAEMHIICKNTKYASLEEASKKVNGIAILAVLFEKHVPSYGRGITALAPALSKIKMSGAQADIRSPPSLLELMPLNLKQFVRYEGSLTAPACKEVVTWIVFLERVNIVDTELMLLRDLQDVDGNRMRDSFRPLQRVNGRSIYAKGLNVKTPC